MQVHKADLIVSAVHAKQYPEDALPEIALAGRSNVGKSSFINKMIQRKGLARTSSQPGKTQTLNFYAINESFRFVDLPGYGYARVSKKERQRWAHFIQDYLLNRDNLGLVLLLMDMRHPPTEDDHAMLAFVEDLDLPHALVLTKADKIKKNQWQTQLTHYIQALDLPSEDALFPFSAQTGQGAQDLWDIIHQLIKQPEL